MIKLVLIGALSLLLMGCATNTIKVPNPSGSGNLLEIAQEFKGRGCIAVESDGEKSKVIVVQDGTSDWSLSRTFEFLGAAASNVFGGSTEADQRGPDPTEACKSVLGVSVVDINNPLAVQLETMKLMRDILRPTSVELAVPPAGE